MFSFSMCTHLFEFIKSLKFHYFLKKNSMGYILVERTLCVCVHKHVYLPPYPSFFPLSRGSGKGSGVCVCAPARAAHMSWLVGGACE